ncbi:hypothetical protein GGR95_000319 [Sulfitobacter undariae]|uniref:DUF4188 domain-containing protein n=1 Tax=Sulfitobacter undariae TaxID=1563671 RepID=A0A7W6E621_9RHOB|nr:DUF4188 domain-containing protein [Sulfitobacter undariae]MBB3992700.1 hypothetical protein [Sulfitobacter undariae]
MTKVIPKRMIAQIEGDFVVFIIGMRINRPWLPHKWLPAVLSMPRMLKELSKLPSEDTGFLGYNNVGFGIVLQYWRSFEHLEAYAQAKDRTHFPAWKAFNKSVRDDRGAVGIFHETFLVKDGQYETLYSGMPPFGLGKASTLVPATAATASARKRLGQGGD